MQDYHSAAKTIARFSSRILEWAKDEWKLEKHSTAIRAFNKDYFIRSKKLYLHAHSGRITTTMILDAYIACCQLDLRFSFELEDTIYRTASKLKPMRTKEEAALFRTLLNQEQGVARSFRSMADLGILERWIPEWKPMVSFFQHNQYHFYTADEHTLPRNRRCRNPRFFYNAVWRCYAFNYRAEIYSICPVSFMTLQSLCISANMKSPESRLRNKYSTVCSTGDILADVSFLVRHHLSMEQVAFRRNLNDTLTIIAILIDVQGLETSFLSCMCSPMRIFRPLTVLS